MDSTGGTPVAVTTLTKAENGHRWPYFLPDGRHFLFVAVDASLAGPAVLFVGSLDAAERTTLASMVSNAVYSSNHLLFSRGGVLVAQPFDAARRQLTGEAFPIANEVETVGGSRRAPFSASPSGVLGYRSGSLLTTLTWFDRTGKVTGTVGDRSSYINLALSPDGRRLAVSQATSSTRNIDIWVFDLERPGSPTRLTTDPAAEFDPTWSPDGSQVLFTSTRTGPFIFTGMRQTAVARTNGYW